MNTQSLRRTLVAAATTATLSAVLAAGVATPALAAVPQNADPVRQSITIPLTAAALQTAQLGPWQTGNISYPSGVPVGGYASLTLRSDGTYEFTGHFHDSGAPSYDDHFAWGVRASDGFAFTFAHRGHMAGTFEAGSRDDDWNVTGYNADIAAHWAALQGYNWRWSANVNWDVVGDLTRIIDALKQIGQVIAVIAVVV